MGLPGLKTRCLVHWPRLGAWLQEASRTMLTRPNWDHQISDSSGARPDPAQTASLDVGRLDKVSHRIKRELSPPD